jgi:hypothetical protein
MMMFTNTEKNSYLRIAKMPKGPTITFKIKSYCLSSDIFQNGKNKKPLTKNFYHIPIIIMNGFNSVNINEKYDMPLKTISMMFQSFFPPLNLTEVQMKKCKRVVLLNLNIEKNNEPELLFRHYDIDIEKFSIKKTISNLINFNGLNKDLSKFNNIADYVLKQSGYTDQSDTDDNIGNCDIITDKNEYCIVLEADANTGVYYAYPIDSINNSKIKDISSGKYVYQFIPTQIEVKVPMIKRIDNSAGSNWHFVTNLDAINNIINAFEEGKPLHRLLEEKISSNK